MKKILSFLVLLGLVGFVFAQNASDDEVTLTANYTQCTPEYGLDVDTGLYNSGADPADMSMQTNLGFGVAVESDGTTGYKVLDETSMDYYNLNLNYNIYCAGGNSQTMTISIGNELEGVSFNGSASTYDLNTLTSSSKDVTISSTATNLFSGLNGSGSVSLGLSAQVAAGATVSSLVSQSTTLVVTLVNDN